MSLFKKVLVDNKLEVTQLSATLQKKITKHGELEAALAEEMKRLETASERAKPKIQQEIETGQATIAELDAEICTSVKRFIRESKRTSTTAKKAGRPRKTTTPPAASGTPPPADPPLPAPNDLPAPVDDPPADPPADPPPADDPPPPPAKSKSGIGWLIGGIAAVALAAVGINYYNNR